MCITSITTTMFNTFLEKCCMSLRTIQHSIFIKKAVHEICYILGNTIKINFKLYKYGKYFEILYPDLNILGIIFKNLLIASYHILYYIYIFYLAGAIVLKLQQAVAIGQSVNILRLAGVDEFLFHNK